MQPANKKNNTLLSLQYFRGLGCMAVVFHHATLNLERHSSIGWHYDTLFIGAALDVFFVISGFIMVVTTWGRNTTPMQFLYRRAVRVIPVYWLYTGAMGLIALLLPQVLNTAQFDTVHFWKSMFFIPEYHPSVEAAIWPILIQGWTLNYEMFFYLLFGIALVARRDIASYALLGCVLIAFAAVGQLIPLSSPAAIFLSDGIVLEFFFGVIVGVLYVQDRLPTGRVAGALFWLSAIAFVLTFIFEPLVERVIQWGIPATAMVIGMVGYERTQGMRYHRYILALGDASYSIYLSHTLTLGAIGWVWAQFTVANPVIDVLAMLVMLSVSAVVGLLSYAWFENPSRIWLGRLVKRRGARARPEGAVRLA